MVLYLEHHTSYFVVQSRGLNMRSTNANNSRRFSYGKKLQNDMGVSQSRAITYASGTEPNGLLQLRIRRHLLLATVPILELVLSCCINTHESEKQVGAGEFEIG